MRERGGRIVARNPGALASVSTLRRDVETGNKISSRQKVESGSWDSLQSQAPLRPDLSVQGRARKPRLRAQEDNKEARLS